MGGGRRQKPPAGKRWKARSQFSRHALLSAQSGEGSATSPQMPCQVPMYSTQFICLDAARQFQCPPADGCRCVFGIPAPLALKPSTYKRLGGLSLSSLSLGRGLSLSSLSLGRGLSLSSLSLDRGLSLSSLSLGSACRLAACRLARAC